MSMKPPMEILRDCIWREGIELTVFSNSAKGFGRGQGTQKATS